MNDKTYNGWSNYATWRVALEIFDGVEVEDITSLEADDITAYEFGKECEAWVDSYLFEVHSGEVSSLVIDYAQAFLAYVNWTEIAKHLLDE